MLPMYEDLLKVVIRKNNKRINDNGYSQESCQYHLFFFSIPKR